MEYVECHKKCHDAIKQELFNKQDKYMNEKRTIKRFALQLEAQLFVDNQQNTKAEMEQSLTKNISSKGAFLLTRQPLPVGTKVGINLFIPALPSTKILHQTTLIKTTGKIVRTNGEGMAVCFNSHCQIAGVGS